MWPYFIQSKHCLAFHLGLRTILMLTLCPHTTHTALWVWMWLSPPVSMKTLALCTACTHKHGRSWVHTQLPAQWFWPACITGQRSHPEKNTGHPHKTWVLTLIFQCLWTAKTCDRWSFSYAYFDFRSPLPKWGLKKALKSYPDLKILCDSLW